MERIVTDFMSKIIITKQNSKLLLSLFKDNKPFLFQTAVLPGDNSLLGNIYLAKVKDVVPAISGAFLSVSAEQTVYLPFTDCDNLLIANRELRENDRIKQDDEIIVQISKEALKTKQPTATTKLSLTGQYCVCEYFGHGLRFSKKINPEKKQLLKEKISSRNILDRKKFSFTIRTNAGMLTDLSPLYEEMETFIHIFNQITEGYKHRTCYSCLYKPEDEIITLLKNIPLSAYDEIITDDANVYSLLENSLSQRVLTINKNIRFYQDEMLSLSKLYSIESHLKEAFGKKVWLPCGGYLVIEPTEAMVVIDVNSGKAEISSKHKNDLKENYILNINIEAAKEVARQLRLRNYSGMIMVDFINMSSDENKQKLLSILDTYLKEDTVKTRLVDMTALGIVEITRKKVNKPLDIT